MTDWQELVRQRLAGLPLASAEKEEVHAELAAHLEEEYESLRAKGLAEQAAMEQTLARVEDWYDLQQRIFFARSGRDYMTNRVKQIWLPGLLTFTVSLVLASLGERLGPQPMFLSLDKGTPILMFYAGWLLTLPLAGAIGAYVSKRAGGSQRMVLASSIFPVLPYAVVFLIAIPIGLVMGRNLPNYIVARAIFIMAIGWVLVPCTALLAGALLVQKLLLKRLEVGGVAGS